MTKTLIGAAVTKRGRFFDPRPFFASAGQPIGTTRYRKGQVITAQGDPVDAVSFVENGAVKLTTHSTHGKKAVVAILGSGDFFGEECLAGHSSRTATVAAMTDCAISRLESTALLDVLERESSFSELFIGYLAAQLIETEENLVDQMLNSTERRIARRLLILAQQDKDGRSKLTTTKINQETLAAMVGTTQSRVSLFMNKFRRAGLIAYDGELRIDTPRLSAFLHE